MVESVVVSRGQWYRSVFPSAICSPPCFFCVSNQRSVVTGDTGAMDSAISIETRSFQQARKLRISKDCSCMCVAGRGTAATVPPRESPFLEWPSRIPSVSANPPVTTGSRRVWFDLRLGRIPSPRCPPRNGRLPLPPSRPQPAFRDRPLPPQASLGLCDRAPSVGYMICTAAYFFWMGGSVTPCTPERGGLKGAKAWRCIFGL